MDLRERERERERNNWDYWQENCCQVKLYEYGIQSEWKHQLKQNTCMELKLINVLTVFFYSP